MPLLLLLLACRGPSTTAPPAPQGPSEFSDAADTGDTADKAETAGEVGSTEVPSLTGPPLAPARQAGVYAAHTAKSVLENQPHRQTTSQAYTLADGAPRTATLVNLAPSIGVWFLLSLTAPNGESTVWHLENPLGTRSGVYLDAGHPLGLVLDNDTPPCELWASEPGPLDEARASGRAYSPVCNGRLMLRTPTTGHKTTLEWTADLLRDHVYGGDRIANTVKQTLFVDAARVTAELGELAASRPTGGPVPADVSPSARGRLLSAADLALPVEGAAGRQMVVGAWYPVHATPGVWASVFEASSVSMEVLERTAGRAAPLDAGESSALVYTAAFNLADFELGYEVGTDHPRVDWSGRVLPEVRDLSLPGPDGFSTLSPLARTGLVDPAYLRREVAVFVAGFKRYHGAFARGELARRNSGSHYGFVEYGTELSRLQPGLATLVVWADQSVELRTWTEADAARLWQVRHARQNGVPILEPDPTTGTTRPGALVRDWAQGNWSGSVSGEQRTVRGGLCIQDSPAGRYLLYSYFSNATPSGMATVYTAYGCSYAMLLDMNALEHTYLAVHAVEAGQLAVHHLVSGMEVLDQAKGSDTYARFVGYADNRDFFYMLRRP